MHSPIAPLSAFVNRLADSETVHELLTLLPEVEQEWNERKDEVLASVLGNHDLEVVLPELIDLACEVAPLYFDC